VGQNSSKTTIVNDEEKEVDKVYLIRWIDNDGRPKLKTVGKHSIASEDFCNFILRI